MTEQNDQGTPAQEARNSDYSAWLIEVDEGASITYFQFVHDDDWTFDQNKAAHFARKQDAESVIKHYGWTRCRAVEHMWPEASARFGQMSGDMREKVARIIDPAVFHERYVEMYPDRSTLEQYEAFKMVDAILAVIASTPSPGGVADEMTIPGTEDMEKRFAWLEAKAIDMGYMLVPEPPHPDSPHAVSEVEALQQEIISRQSEIQLLRDQVERMREGIRLVVAGLPAGDDIRAVLEPLASTEGNHG